MKQLLDLAKDGTKAAIKDICEAAEKYKDKRDDKDFIVAKFHEIILKYSPMGDDVSRKIEKVGKPTAIIIHQADFFLSKNCQ